MLSALSDALFLTVGFHSRGQILSCARVIVATARKVSRVQKSRQDRYLHKTRQHSQRISNHFPYSIRVV